MGSWLLMVIGGTVFVGAVAAELSLEQQHAKIEEYFGHQGQIAHVEYYTCESLSKNNLKCPMEVEIDDSDVKYLPRPAIKEVSSFLEQVSLYNIECNSLDWNSKKKTMTAIYKQARDIQQKEKKLLKKVPSYQIPTTGEDLKLKSEKCYEKNRKKFSTLLKTKIASIFSLIA